jgi:hypothetical protein
LIQYRFLQSPKLVIARFMRAIQLSLAKTGKMDCPDKPDDDEFCVARRMIDATRCCATKRPRAFGAFA